MSISRLLLYIWCSHEFLKAWKRSGMCTFVFCFLCVLVSYAHIFWHCFSISAQSLRLFCSHQCDSPLLRIVFLPLLWLPSALIAVKHWWPCTSSHTCIGSVTSLRNQWGDGLLGSTLCWPLLYRLKCVCFIFERMVNTEVSCQLWPSRISDSTLCLTLASPQWFKLDSVHFKKDWHIWKLTFWI